MATKTAKRSRGGAPEGNQNALGNAGGAGGPAKYGPSHPKRAYQLALLGLTDREIAGIFDVSEVTINNWKRDHVEFALALTAGKTPADGKVAASLFRKALSGDVSAQRYWLNNRQKGRWADRHEFTGEGGAPISFIIEGAPGAGEKS